MKKITLFHNWTEDNLYPHDWSNRSRYKNYLARTSMGQHGKILKDFLEPSKDNDLYFNVANVESGCILLASCWDSRKNRQYKTYWLVIERTDEYIGLIDYSTYRSACKDWESGDYLLRINEENNLAS